MSGFYPHDFQTDTWRRLQAHMQERLTVLRAELEAPGLDNKPESSIRLRAKITELKDLLAIPGKVEEQARAEGERAHTTT